MEVSSLFIYPVKSARAISANFAETSRYGLLSDREYMVVSPITGKFITQRENPKMATLGVRQLYKMTMETQLVYEDRTCDITPMNHIAQDAEKVSYKHHRDIPMTGYDCGDAAASFIGDVLGEPARLIWHGYKFDRAVNPLFATAPEQLVSYADGYPYLITTLASLAAFNEGMRSLGLEILGMDRFRPNIVIEGDFPAFDEESWKRIRIESGPSIVEFDLVKPCDRCQIPSTDQQTGERLDLGSAIKGLKAAGQFGQIVQGGAKGAFFGMNAIQANGKTHGTIHVGGKVNVVERHPEPLWKPLKKRP